MAPRKASRKAAEKAVEVPVAPVDETPEAKAVTELMEKLTLNKSGGSSELVDYVKKNGLIVLKSHGVMDKLVVAANNIGNQATREGALAAMQQLLDAFQAGFEPFLIEVVPVVLDKYADKSAAVKEAAEKLMSDLLSRIPDAAVKTLLMKVLTCCEPKLNWQTKVGACEAVLQLTKQAPKQMALCMPELMPSLGQILGDAKPQVKKVATEAMTACCGVIGNIDIEAVIPVLVSCIANPNQVPDTVHRLGATTFVQAVEAPTLAVLVPLLVRGLRERQTAIKRKSALIIDNMCKLVDNPHDAVVFLPRLLPGVETLAKEVSDPECRGVAERAHKTLLRVQKEAEEQLEGKKEVEPEKVLETLKKLVKAPVDATTLGYVSAMCAQRMTEKNYQLEEWTPCATPYLSAYMSVDEADSLVKTYLDACEKIMEDGPSVEDDEEGEDLCNCEFSLGYGAKILMNNARMHLKRGRRYGLCGANGTGKSTLMRSIANGQVENFPPKDELRTVYVEHDIDGSLSELSVVEFVFSDPILQDTTHPAHGEVEKVLSSVGFTEEMQEMPVASLSGGWKMKLALARAMLMKADILLLDEPTNHLDVSNVQWLVDYLCSLASVTSIIVSHDSGFLDNVCTHVLHLDNRKLKTYRGNLSEFVKKVPEAKSYYELGATQLKFKFPEPGFLEGVKTKDKAILKMHNVAFKYPNTERIIISGVSIYCTLNSRVAVIGKNGAGKSTMIKLLTGEMEATEGTVYRHPNLRIAYVAQHAFHHLEEHLDKTPNQYIQWRYATGEDREDTLKVTRQVTEEEKKMMDAAKVIDGQKMVVEKLLMRRKKKNNYEYEVQFKNKAETMWIDRDELETMGFAKMCIELDMKEAARQGMILKPLTAANVQKHLEAVGIEAEFGTHSHIRGLSGGQKVKVVIGAAMWNNPHMLVLDEPTNYLDRESLGAVAEAIKDFGGGVVIISHNQEFVDAVCSEQWLMADGKLTPKNQAKIDNSGPKLAQVMQEEVTDSLGNTIKVKGPKKTLSRQEKKKAAKIKAARRARGEEVSSDEDE